MSSVTDGTSQTFMLGEKYADPKQYYTGTSYGDDQGPYTSDERDIIRWGRINGNNLVPQKDTPGLDLTFNFGSAHSSVFQMAFCDGHVRGISYYIDMDVFLQLCNRMDGSAVGEY